MKQRLNGLVLVTILTFVCCSNPTKPPKQDPTDRIKNLVAQTPRADTEAELAALCLSNEFVVSESLYLDMREALKAVRLQYGTLPSEISRLKLGNIGFSHFWSLRSVYPELTPQGIEEYRAGRHHDLDSLNDLLNGEILDTVPIWFADGRLIFEVRIKFAGVLNYDSVCAFYRKLPSVGGIDFCCYFMDGPNVYPWRLTDGRLTLLFRDAQGDCPSGCIYSHFWYFRIDDQNVEYVGEYIADYQHPEPDWWPEAKVAYYVFKFGHLP